VGYAEAVVARFPAPLPASLLAVRGQLRQFGHDFDGALQDFANALALEPDLATAHAWRGAILLVQAQYDRALAECTALDRLGRRSLHAGCLGLAQAYGGRLQEAQLTLQQALDGSSQPEQRLWLLTRLGEVAAWRAQPAQAERYYREALALGLDDGYLLAAWSDFLLDAGRPAEVIEWLSSWEASDPLLLRLAEAESALGRPEAARHVQVLEDRFAAARLRGDTTHRAEEARYRLRLRGDAEAALRLAVENYRGQREPRDARILLEAATAAGDGQAAAAVKDWLRTSGFEDPRLRQLAHASGNRTGSAAGPASGRP
jgi:Tfp pilus assembly protein PilF